MKAFFARIWWYVCSKLRGHGQRSPLNWFDASRDSRALFLERRFEARQQSTRSCRLGVMQSIGQSDAVFEEQVGLTINESKSGLQLLLGTAPEKGKLIEVHLDARGMKPAFSLVEVQWSKLLRKTQEGELYLVGCRMSFGPYTYWAF